MTAASIHPLAAQGVFRNARARDSALASLLVVNAGDDPDDDHEPAHQPHHNRASNPA